MSTERIFDNSQIFTM